MKQRWPKTYRGGLDQDLYRSKAFKIKSDRLGEIQEKLTEKMNKGGLTLEQLEKLERRRENVASAIARYGIRTHNGEKVKELKQTYDELPTVQKLRNEVAHRLSREAGMRVEEEFLERSREIRLLKKEYANAPEEKRAMIQREMDKITRKQPKSQKLRHEISLLAASVKLVTGLDDSAAIKRAIEIGKKLPRKDPDFIGEVADDVFLMGEKSIYLKRLNTDKQESAGL